MKIEDVDFEDLINELDVKIGILNTYDVNNLCYYLFKVRYNDMNGEQRKTMRHYVSILNSFDYWIDPSSDQY